MALKVGLFEDDTDLADDLKRDLSAKGFNVSCVFSLESSDWQQNEIILADYRNRLVPFEKLRAICEKKNIPLIVISGAECNYRPQVLKPFTVDQLQRAIMSEMMAHNKRKDAAEKGGGLFKSLSGLLGGSKKK